MPAANETLSSSLDPSTLTPTQAIALQRRWADRVERTTRWSDPPRWIAAADVSCARFSDRLYAGIVVWDRKTGAVVERAGVVTTAHFPYIPGLLSFREAPGLLQALAQLRRPPDLLLVDGAGYAHPRRFGLACHLGVCADLPAIGCAKSRLIGTYREPGDRRGAGCQLCDGGEVIGRVLRTRDGVKPLYLSVGHRVGLADACKLVLSVCRGVRLPEPIRLAHQYVNELRLAARR